MHVTDLDSRRRQCPAAADVQAGQVAQVHSQGCLGRIRQPPAAVQPQRPQPRAAHRQGSDAVVANL